MSPETSDELLMLAFQKGDARAFETLVRRHRGPVFNFILRFTGNRARAEDILQDTWIKVVRSSPEYEPKARFVTWVYTIARNLCVDSARKESYRSADSLDSDERPIDPGSSADLPDQTAYHREVRPLLERAIAKLPEEQREVFLLREMSGMSFKEISEATVHSGEHGEEPDALRARGDAQAARVAPASRASRTLSPEGRWPR